MLHCDIYGPTSRAVNTGLPRGNQPFLSSLIAEGPGYPSEDLPVLLDCCMSCLAVSLNQRGTMLDPLRILRDRLIGRRVVDIALDKATK